MGKEDMQPDAWGHTRERRTKTSKHVSRHERRRARQERAYARGADRPKEDNQ